MGYKEILLGLMKCFDYSLSEGRLVLSRNVHEICRNPYALSVIDDEVMIAEYLQLMSEINHLI